MNFMMKKEKIILSKFVVLFSMYSIPIISKSIMSIKNDHILRKYIKDIEQINIEKRRIDRLFDKYNEKDNFPNVVFIYKNEHIDMDMIKEYAIKYKTLNIKIFKNNDELYSLINDAIVGDCPKKEYVFLNKKTGSIHREIMDDITLYRYSCINNIVVVQNEEEGKKLYIEELKKNIKYTQSSIKHYKEMIKEDEKELKEMEEELKRLLNET